MTCQDNEKLLNGLLISLSRSFLQYLAESSPWVDVDQEVSVTALIEDAAGRQQADVRQIVALLQEREYAIDFGSYPTEYTDLQFLSLKSILTTLKASHDSILAEISDCSASLAANGDTAAADLVSVIAERQKELAGEFEQMDSQLTTAS